MRGYCRWARRRIYKRHAGVQSEFHRLVKDQARVDDQIRAFLGRSYDLKSIADYETGPGSHISATARMASGDPLLLSCREVF